MQKSKGFTLPKVKKSQGKRKKNKSLSGFTTLELLIAISVIVVITAIVIANFPKVKTQLALSRAAYKFAQDVSRAQKMALSSVEYKDSSGTPQPVDGYGIYVDFNADALNISDGHHQYILYADKSPQDEVYALGDYIFDFVDLRLSEPGIMIKEIIDSQDSNAGQKSYIHFTFPNAQAVIQIIPSGLPSPLQSKITVVFALESDLTKTKTVFVNSSGLVEVQ